MYAQVDKRGDAQLLKERRGVLDAVEVAVVSLVDDTTSEVLAIVAWYHHFFRIAGSTWQGFFDDVEMEVLESYLEAERGEAGLTRNANGAP